MRGWIAMAFGKDHAPYADKGNNTYTFDEHSQNHKQVAEGDFLFIRNRLYLEGVGRIGVIDKKRADKLLLRCPVCGAGRIGERKKRKPAYRCIHGHTFDTPEKVKQPVKTFIARFGNDYLPIRKRIVIAELRAFELHRNKQLALMPVDVDALCRYLAKRDPAIALPLSAWTMPRWVSMDDHEADDSQTYVVPGLDDRDQTIQWIRLRRGRSVFRERLLKRYEGQCLISGCRVTALLEAAHIRPYRGPHDNHPANGLLLRSDLHTLFDLNKLAIDPDTMSVAIHPDLAGSEYEKFSGTKLMLTGDSAPDRRALRTRWIEFFRQTTI